MEENILFINLSFPLWRLACLWIAQIFIRFDKIIEGEWNLSEKKKKGDTRERLSLFYCVPRLFTEEIFLEG